MFYCVRRERKQRKSVKHEMWGGGEGGEGMGGEDLLDELVVVEPGLVSTGRARTGQVVTVAGGWAGLVLQVTSLSSTNRHLHLQNNLRK